MKYKAGDKVKIKANVSSHEFEIGEPVEIIGRYSYSVFYYKAKNKTLPDWYLVCDEDLE